MKDKKMSGAFGLLTQGLNEKQERSTPVERSQAKIEEKPREAPEHTKQQVSNKAPERKQAPGRRLLEIDPKRIRSWAFNDREESDLHNEDFQELMQSIKDDGQQQPIKVRPLKSKDFDYEQVYGFRRLHACKALGIKVLAIVDDIDDRKAFVVQLIENDKRIKPPAWRRALSFKKAWDNQIWPTMEAMAVETRVARSTLSNYLRIAQNMPEVFQANIELSNCSRDALFALLDIAEQSDIEDWIMSKPKWLNKTSISESDIKKSYNAFVKNKPAEGEVEKQESVQGTRTFVGKAGKLFSINRRGETVTINILKDGKRIMTDDEIAEALQKIMNEKA